MEVKVVITFAPEAKNLLERLVGKLSVGQSTQIAVSTPETPAQEKKKATKEAKVEAESTEEEESVDPSVTIEEIRSLAAKAIKKDRDKTKEILTSFDASSVSTLDEEHYDAFYEKIGELV